MLIEDLYILVVPRKEDDQDPDELERRTQVVKLERLHNAEVLQTQTAGIKGMDPCSENSTVNLTAFKVPKMTLKVKASSNHSSQSF